MTHLLKKNTDGIVLYFYILLDYLRAVDILRKKNSYQLVFIFYAPDPMWLHQPKIPVSF